MISPSETMVTARQNVVCCLRYSDFPASGRLGLDMWSRCWRRLTRQADNVRDAEFSARAVLCASSLWVRIEVTANFTLRRRLYFSRRPTRRYGYQYRLPARLIDSRKKLCALTMTYLYCCKSKSHINFFGSLAQVGVSCPVNIVFW